jgi:peptide/nickel transport system permease protein
MTSMSIPSKVTITTEKEAQVYVAPQWKLVWWKFRKHKLALASGIIVILIYLVALFVEFLSPFPSDRTDSKFLYAPPQTLHLFDEQACLS